jgi:hypothetical protein
MTEITVIVHGPLFDGRAGRMVDHMCTEVQQDIAELALDTWQLNAERTFKEPTGRYQEHMQVAKRDNADVVTDGWPGSGLQYGPWLEGLGSRNRTTRFKGYWNLKRAFETTQRYWRRVAQPRVDKWVAEINEQGG